MSEIKSLLQVAESGKDLTATECEQAIHEIMQGVVANETIAAFLLALRAKGESVDEIAGAAKALRRNMTPIQSSRAPLVDTCGTGGDGSNTFNISTAAGLIASAAGVSVAKHGNRKVSSKTGSADALTELGVNIAADVSTVQRCLDELGVCFCFAPLFHSSMRNVGQVRKELAVPTIFNMLGPLCNPAGAEHQVLGVGKPEIQESIAKALFQLGTTRSIVVYGTDQLCEISNAAPTRVFEVDRAGIRETQWTPNDFGLDFSTREELVANDPVESAEIISGVLGGKLSAARDIVILNAAAAIWLGGKASDLKSAATLAAECIDSGQASNVLKELAALSHSAG